MGHRQAAFRPMFFSIHLFTYSPTLFFTAGSLMPAEELKNAGVTQFGSGWAWLVTKNGKLEITKTANADTPVAHGIKPLLTVDVWEHAYYLDYQNRRPDFIQAVIDNLINWDFVNSRLK